MAEVIKTNTKHWTRYIWKQSWSPWNRSGWWGKCITVDIGDVMKLKIDAYSKLQKFKGADGNTSELECQ